MHQLLLSWWTQKSIELTAHMPHASWTNWSIWQLDILILSPHVVDAIYSQLLANCCYILLHNPVDMVHQHLRLTHTHPSSSSSVNYATHLHFIHPHGIFVEDIKAPIETKIWYECHPCMLSITQTEASMMVVSLHSQPWMPCPVTVRDGHGMLISCKVVSAQPSLVESWAWN
jgi:hypothetical protein